jgi:phage shock protein E
MSHNITLITLINNNQMKLKEILTSGALVIDVRTPAEYSSGHFPGSANIPLDVVPAHMPELKGKQKAIITVCRSGARSGMAAEMLKAQGIEAYNGGGWTDFQAAVR